MTNKYLEMKRKHQEEVNNFPIFFAFSDKQFIEGMHKFGLNEDQTDKIYSIGGGGYILKTDSKALHEMFERHDKERQEAIENDIAGNGYIYDMFNYELSNHEYIITYSVEETLNVLGLTIEEIEENPKLRNALNKAKKAQFDN